MTRFEINKTYYDDQRNAYTVLNRTTDKMTVKFNRVIKEYRIIEYCGVEAVIQYGVPKIKAGPIKFQFDDEFDLDIIKPQKSINNERTRYINVFKVNKSI